LVEVRRALRCGSVALDQARIIALSRRVVEQRHRDHRRKRPPTASGAPLSARARQPHHRPVARSAPPSPVAPVSSRGWLGGRVLERVDGQIDGFSGVRRACRLRRFGSGRPCHLRFHAGIAELEPCPALAGSARVAATSASTASWCARRRAAPLRAR
jgi:hypothetical protein